MYMGPSLVGPFSRSLICAMRFLDGIIIIWSTIYFIYLFVIFGVIVYLNNSFARSNETQTFHRVVYK